MNSLRDKLTKPIASLRRLLPKTKSPMRNLFYKVFALILFSAVALFAAVGAVFHFIDDDDINIGYEFAYRTAHETVAIYESKGAHAVTHSLRELHEHTGIRAFFMHGDGRAIGRRAPRFVREKITESPQAIESPHNDRDIRAVSVSGAQGNSYRLVLIAGRGNAPAWIFRHTSTRVVMSLLVIALASLLISLLITRPLGGLKSATKNFSGGNLTARAPARITRRNDAFGELAREFDLMSARIEKLVGGHRRLLRDVSHELRSPLSRMQVAATLLEDQLHDKTDAESQRQVARIHSEILRLDEMIARLLSVSRLQAGALAPAPQKIDLYALLERVARDAEYEFSEQNKRVEMRGDAIQICADPEQLRSAFENVIRNGLRYAKSSLVITLKRDGANTKPMVVVTVCDDGPGVHNDELQNIFAPFYRPDESRSEATGNAGIGLAIARGIVLAHNGNIDAANAVTGGLVITISLPIS